MIIALGVWTGAHAAPKTRESLCGALLLTPSPQAPASHVQLLKYISQMSEEGALDQVTAEQIKLDLNQSPNQRVIAIKGREAIATYLSDFNAALTEFDELGHGAYRNLRPSPAKLGVELAKGLGVQGAGLAAAAHLGPALGLTTAFVGLAYLLKQIARTGYGWLAHYSRAAEEISQRGATDRALDAFNRVVDERADEKLAYDVLVAIDRDYTEELKAARDLTELPVRALGRALMRRRNFEKVATDQVEIMQALFTDAADQKPVLVSIVRIERQSSASRPAPPRPRRRLFGRAVTTKWSVENTLPGDRAAIEFRPAL